MAAVLPLQPTDTFAGTIASPGEVDAFQVTLADSGRLTADVRIGTGTSLATRLSLLGPSGQLLIQSDGLAVARSGGQITQDVLAGTYVLEVTGLGAGTGTYTLTTQFHQATPPDQPLGVNFNQQYPWRPTPPFAVTGDFNGDGHLDLATADTNSASVTVLLGLGDGTFQSPQTFTVGGKPQGIVAGDFNGDGRLDLATINDGSGDVSILLGNGDGTFQPEKRIALAPGAQGWGLAAADLTGDGHLDLIAVNRPASGGTGSVSILLGNGDGTFQPERRYAVGDFPGYVAVGDFSGDGHLDLAVSNFGSSDISLLRGKGDGTFRDEVRVPLPPGSNPSDIVAGDFNGDGRLDLAVADTGTNDVSVLLGNGNGTFQSPVHYATGTSPVGLVAGDFTGHGHLDLATSNKDSGDVSVLLGRGDGTFQDQARYQTGFKPWFVVTGDFNRDGIPDLATANALSHDVSILLGLGNGTFLSDLANPRPAQVNPQGVAVEDFNRDGIPDLATVSYSGHDLFVFLGRGDGTFQERMRLPTGSTPVWVISADVNGDGIPDLVTANCFSANVSVFLGRGDGTFQPAVNYPASIFTDFVIAGDFTGDGHLDLFTGGDFSNQFAFLKGNGDGTFQPAKTFNLPFAGAMAVAGHFFGDSHLDLAVTNFFDPNGSISILRGRGDGTFEDPVYYAVGSQPLGIVAGDFGNGHLDLAVTDSGSNDVAVLLGRGDGTFAPAVRYPVGVAPDSIVAADFNGDGHLDLAVTNGGSTYVSLLLGRGDGTFEPQRTFPLTDPPTPHRGLVAADFTGDGHLDLATPELLTSNDISVLLGNGDGTFQAPIHFAVGLGPVAMVSGDFSNSGRRDVASVNPTTNEVSVALGGGDGTLQAPVSYPVGNTPVALVTGDFNGDGRLDLAIVNFASNDVSVLLGLGDGTFRPEQRYAVGTNPTSIVVGDFNHDGHLDLAVSNAGSNDISVLFGRGDGTFQPQVRIVAPGLPQALVAGDFNGDGILDLATADYRSQDVAVFLGRGDGTFQAPVQYALGTAPVALIAADLTGDGHLDLVTANFLSNDVSILLGRGNGMFQPAIRYEAGSNPLAVVAGDLNGDGHPDLAVADSTGNAVALLFGRGDGTFAPPVQRPVPAYPRALIADDFNNDGRTDLAVATQFASDVSILSGTGDGTFLSPDTIANEIHATPLVADLNGDGTPDVVVLNRAGEILVRYGRPDTPGTFDPPVILNPDPRFAVRDLALVRTSHGLVLAALDARDSALSFYARRPDGTFTRTAGPTIPGVLPVHLAAGDLNGDGRDDLVVAATGTNRVFVYLQKADGGFGPTPDYQSDVGIDPSALSLADVNGDGRVDIVITNQFSGDVSVLLNDPAKPFCAELRFRAGIGLYWVDQNDSSLVMRSFQGSAGVVSGIFDEGKPTDLVVTNSGANSFSLLQGTGLGGFLNPQAARSFSTGVRPTAVVAGDFNHDGHLDLAILNEVSQDLSIFLGDGHGGFTEKTVTGPDGRPIRLSAGNAPTGLALADVNGDGIPDLLVGNQFGDVLVLLGKGDGTFQPYQRTDQRIALAIADLNGDGRQEFIFANAGLDRITVQYPQPGQTFTQDRSNGLLAPGAVAVADLNGDGIPDLVVANSGGNNVLVYLGLGNGQFAPARSFFAGTNPAGVTIADLTGGGIPDLVVANEGSNDVSILLGQGRGADWTLVPGPRLRAGAGPVSTTVADVTGHGIPDIVVANSQSNNVYVLPGVGNGFFNDQHPLVLNTGVNPRQVLVGDFTGDGQLELVSINTGSNDLTFFRDFGAGRSIASGGDRPLAAVAGDFNHDGITDLLVVNNGDGREALLLGGVDGLTLTQTFSRSDVPHPTAIALAASAEGEDVYVVDDSRESAVLLTSFGIAVPLPRQEGQRPTLTDLFVVNGPGFATGVDIFSPRVDLPSLRAEFEDRREEGAAPVGLGGSPLADVFVVNGPGFPTGPSTLILPSEASLTAALTLAFANGEVEDLTLSGNAPADESALNKFRMGLEDALRRIQQDSLPGTPNGNSVPADPVPDGLDQVFRRGLQPGADFEGLQSAASLLRGNLDPLGMGALPLSELPWEAIAKGLQQSETFVGDLPSEVLSGLFGSGSAPSEADRPDAGWAFLPEPREQEGQYSGMPGEGETPLESVLLKMTGNEEESLAGPLVVAWLAFGLGGDFRKAKKRSDPNMRHTGSAVLW
jgi:hypothetical protein